MFRTPLSVLRSVRQGVPPSMRPETVCFMFSRDISSIYWWIFAKLWSLVHLGRDKEELISFGVKGQGQGHIFAAESSSTRPRRRVTLFSFDSKQTMGHVNTDTKRQQGWRHPVKTARKLPWPRVVKARMGSGGGAPSLPSGVQGQTIYCTSFAIKKLLKQII